MTATSTGSGDPASRALPPIRALGVATKERPQALRRALSSYIENGRRYGRTTEFLVLDDAEREGACLELARELKGLHRADVRYAGRPEKREFARALALEGISPDTAEFALLGAPGCAATAGANRNSFLLESAGERAFMADDDTVCRVAAAPPGIQEGGQARSAANPMEHWFFPDRAAALASARFVEADLLAQHETLLGRGLVECLEPGVEGGALGPRLKAALASGKGKVRLTFNGYLGHSACSPSAYLELAGSSRARLMESEVRYREVLRRMETCRVVRRATVSDGRYCMAAFLGLDNRALLPPFMPVLRNEDGVFGTLLWKCFEDAFTAHLPWALVHDPLEERVRPAEDCLRAEVLFNDVVKWGAISAELGTGPADGPGRLRSLGLHFQEAAGLAPGDFAAWARRMAMAKLEARATELRRLLKAHGEEPGFWAADARAALAEIERAGRSGPEPGDLPGDGAAWETARGLLGRFGRLLREWPDVVEAARRLRARGRRVSREL